MNVNIGMHDIQFPRQGKVQILYPYSYVITGAQIFMQKILLNIHILMHTKYQKYIKKFIKNYNMHIPIYAHKIKKYTNNIRQICRTRMYPYKCMHTNTRKMIYLSFF